MVIPPEVLLLLGDCFGYLRLFVVSYKVEHCSLKVYKSYVGILVEIALNMLIAFGKMDIFTMLILLFHEHGRTFHLLISSSISFFGEFKFFLLCRSCTCLSRVTPGYFILFMTIIKGIASLISLLALLSFV